MANILRMEIILMNYWNHKKMRYEIENCQLLAIILRVYINNYYKDKDRETLELCIFLVSFSVIFTNFSLFLDYRSIYIYIHTVFFIMFLRYYGIKIEIIMISKLTFIKVIAEVIGFWTSAWKSFVTIDLI